MPDYSKGKIYKIECNITGEVYYGSTTKRWLCDRIGGHRYSAKYNTQSTFNSSQIINRGNYNYKVVEYCPCENKIELETRERWWIENNVCVNRNIPLHSRAEYYQKNKEYWQVKNKQKYEENRDNALKQQQEYRKKNIEIIKSKQNEKFTCDCGGKYTRSNYSQHIKSKKHQDFISCHTDNP